MVLELMFSLPFYIFPDTQGFPRFILNQKQQKMKQFQFCVYSSVHLKYRHH